DQVELLEDHTDTTSLTPVPGRLFRARHANASLGRRGDPGDAAKQRRLARAAQAQNGDELGLMDAETHPADRPPSAVGLAEVLDMQADRSRRLRSASTRASLEIHRSCLSLKVGLGRRAGVQEPPGNGRSPPGADVTGAKQRRSGCSASRDLREITARTSRRFTTISTPRLRMRT